MSAEAKQLDEQIKEIGDKIRGLKTSNGSKVKKRCLIKYFFYKLRSKNIIKIYLRMRSIRKYKFSNP